ncbi:hypothetical protein B0H10DRAFT_1974839 [Mycena sp. CBHHK59/15]|nr:hypothetical protein B0H10DRAFT_1974839 [Mycena sp. CBHHK59/15]
MVLRGPGLPPSWPVLSAEARTKRRPPVFSARSTTLVVVGKLSRTLPVPTFEGAEKSEKNRELRESLREDTLEKETSNLVGSSTATFPRPLAPRTPVVAPCRKKLQGYREPSPNDHLWSAVLAVAAGPAHPRDPHPCHTQIIRRINIPNLPQTTYAKLVPNDGAQTTDDFQKIHYKPTKLPVRLRRVEDRSASGTRVVKEKRVEWHYLMANDGILLPLMRVAFSGGGSWEPVRDPEIKHLLEKTSREAKCHSTRFSFTTRVPLALRSSTRRNLTLQTVWNSNTVYGAHNPSNNGEFTGYNDWPETPAHLACWDSTPLQVYSDVNASRDGGAQQERRERRARVPAARRPKADAELGAKCRAMPTIDGFFRLTTSHSEI